MAAGNTAVCFFIKCMTGKKEIFMVLMVTKHHGYGKIICGRLRRQEGRDKMYIIAGLGNPDRQYEGTRHNAGFDVIDRIADKYNIAVDTRKHRALIGKGIIEGQKVILAKPQTYMNLSGESIRSMADYYKIDPEHDLVVIYDDINLEPGQLRSGRKEAPADTMASKASSPAWVPRCFGGSAWGVGEKPSRYDLADYVLGHFSKAEKELMAEGYDHAADAAAMILAGRTRRCHE